MPELAREQRGQDRGRHEHGAADRHREAQAAPAARDAQRVLERAEDGVEARHDLILQRVVDRPGSPVDACLRRSLCVAVRPSPAILAAARSVAPRATLAAMRATGP
jgi:hypothetical protein